MLKVIIQKELKRVFTDKRLVFSSFILPAISIFIVYTIMGTMITNMMDDIEEHRSIIYVKNSPQDFNEYYESIKEHVNMSLKFLSGTEDITSIRENIKSGRVDLLIEFEDGFERKVKNYKIESIPPQIKTFYNPSEDYSNRARNSFIYEVLEGYKNLILINRFGNIDYVRAFDIDRENDKAIIVDEKKATGQDMSMIFPMLIGILLFAGAMGIGIDTIAGEKERGTMATLLLAPIKRETIAIGKVVSLGIVAIISAFSSFAGILASMPFASNVLTGNDEGLNISGLFSPLQYIQLLFIMISLVGIYVGIVSLLSVRARTVKEAGTYVAPVYMVVMIAAFSTMFSGATTSLYHYAIPVYGSVSALKAAFSFELTTEQFFVTVISAIIVTLVLIKLITRTFKNEKVMLNA